MRREFTVAVFVVHDGAVLFLYHRKLGRWLPPGGHVDGDELPDAAATRETLEETGVLIEVIDATTPAYCDVPRPAGVPSRLPGPIGIQLEDIPGRPGNPAHQHVDLIYAARVAPGTDPTPSDGEGGAHPTWSRPRDWPALDLTAEVRSWAEAAMSLAGATSEAPSRREGGH